MNDTTEQLIVGALFPGIGGIEIGFESEGFTTGWFAEIDPYANAVLTKHWPDTPNHGNVKTIDYGTVQPVDVLTGGFPCQPHSQAGKRQASKDDRDLWPECRRAIQALRPRACVFENVPGLLTSEKGEFFKRIIDDFYRLGYRPRVYRLSARAVGSPHLRRRIFIVAYPDSTELRVEPGRGGGPDWARQTQLTSDGEKESLANADCDGREQDGYEQSITVPPNRESERPTMAYSNDSGLTDRPEQSWRQPTSSGTREHRSGRRGAGINLAVADTDGFPGKILLKRRAQITGGSAPMADASNEGDVRWHGELGAAQAGVQGPSGGPSDGGGERGEPESRLGRGAYGVPGWLDEHQWPAGPQETPRDWEPPRTATGVRHRVNRLKCLGNAVVPQCAAVIARIVKQELLWNATR